MYDIVTWMIVKAFIYYLKNSQLKYVGEIYCSGPDISPCLSKNLKLYLKYFNECV